MGRVGAAPVRIEPKPEPVQPKRVIPNADTEFVKAEVLAEVMAEELAKKADREQPDKAKAEEIPAEPTEDSHRPHGHGIHSKQFYKE